VVCKALHASPKLEHWHHVSAVASSGGGLLIAADLMLSYFCLRIMPNMHTGIAISFYLRKATALLIITLVM